MSPPPDPSLTPTAALRLDALCDRFEADWYAGARPRIEDFLDSVDPSVRGAALRELIRLEVELRRSSGERPTGFDYAGRFSTYGDLVDDALQVIGDELPSTSPIEPAPIPAASAFVPRGRDASRFRVLRPLARGGLGQVSVALDGELRREVALKEILPARADDSASRFRFVLEAEVTGHLEHPGIVPVYSLGADEAGRPFYAMRLVRGESLHQAIKRHHDGRPGCDAGALSLEFRQLLGRFVAVCNAVAYAHGRGVIHRDLKPANILLGPFGETLVVDWGLAKVIGGAEGVGDDALPPIDLGPSSGTAETRSGYAFGTPAFMSPEQAEGRPERVGPASDIYSLGATLYVLLVGRSPMEGLRAVEAIERVRAGAFPRPRDVDPSVPRAVEAVCLKAMALRPEDRYATATDLATDLDRFLADEPVSVVREPWTVRAGRWARRHRTPVAVGASLLVATTVGLSIGAALLARANVQTERARKLAVDNEQVARRNLAEAEANFALAQGAINEFLQQMGKERLLNEPNMIPLRRELLSSALGFTRTLLERKPDDPRVLGDLAETTGLLAMLESRIGERDAALRRFAEAADLFRKALPVQPERRTLRVIYGHLVGDWGEVLEERGRPVEAEAHYRDSLRILTGPGRPEPDAQAYALVASQTLRRLARLQGNGKRFDEAQANLDEALRSIESNGDDPEPEASIKNRSDVFIQRGAIALAQTRYVDALSAHLVSYELSRQLLARFGEDSPRRIDYRLQAITCQNNVAVALSRLRRDPDSIHAFEETIARARELLRDFPELILPRRMLGIALSNLAPLYQRTGRPDDAERALTESTEAIEALSRREPSNQEYRENLGNALGNLGNLLLSRREFARAVPVFERSLEVLDPLTNRRVGRPETLIVVRNNAWGLADALVGLKRFAEADPAFGRAMEAASGRPRDELALERARVRALAGDHRGAEADSAPFLDGRDLFHRLLAARNLVAAAGAVGDDASLDSATRDRRREELFGRALAVLDGLGRANWFDRPDRIRRLDGPDFAPIRDRPSFRALRDDLRFPANPFMPAGK